MDKTKILMNNCSIMQAESIAECPLEHSAILLTRVGIIKIEKLSAIICNLIIFSKVIACNCNSDISLVTILECYQLQGQKLE